jgi:dUTP diphosphatase
MKIKAKKLRPDAKLPSYALNGDAGLDMFSDEHAVIEPGKQYIFATGFALEIPKGFCALVWDKGGLSQKHGLKTMGGVFEHTYRGEYMICLLNTSDKSYEFHKGDKIAQLLIQPIVTAEFEEVTELSDSERGDGRYGSTGK